jgi:MFS family permease
MPPRRGSRALDFLNFFIADVQTGFGPFVAVYLTAQKWTQIDIGFVLSLGTAAALVSQVPAGILVDAITSKRAAAGAGIVAITGSALLLATAPVMLPVAIAELLHGFASCIIGPAIAAISLRIAGHDGLGERLGRNARFASIGNGIAAAALGAAGTYLSPSAVFWLTAALGLPALWMLAMIGPQAAYPRGDVATSFDWRAVARLLTDSRLLAFGGCALLFHMSNAALLPLAASMTTRQVGASANLIIAASIVVPQAVVAIVSPWVGRAAQIRGRRFVLLLGWGALPVRALLMALEPAPTLLIGIQALSGISAAVFGIMLPLVAADITEKDGRLNLCMGLLGVAVFVGATASTTLAGWISDVWGNPTAFLGLGAAGLAGTALVWLAMPETRLARGPARAATGSA